MDISSQTPLTEEPQQDAPVVLSPQSEVSPSAQLEITPASPASAEPLIANAEPGHASPGVHLRSKKAWLWTGVAIALLNPIFSGLLFGIMLWRESEMRREGKIVTAIAALWGVTALIVFFVTRGAGIS